MTVGGLVGCGQTSPSASLLAPQDLQHTFIGEVGVDSHFIWAPEPEAQTALTLARTAGFEWIREDFPWNDIEPERGVFNWSRTDALMTAAAAARVHVLAILDFAPPWASTAPPGSSDPNYPPLAPSDYAAFAAAVLARYGPGGSFWSSVPGLVPAPLEAVELWNEPWGHWAWKPNPDPAAYDRLVRAAVPAIRAVAPHTNILISGDLYQVRADHRPEPWLADLLDVDPTISHLVDAYSVHPYPGDRKSSPDDNSHPEFGFDRVLLSEQLLQQRHAQLPIWITEIGWTTAPDSDESVSDAQQAQYLEEVVTRALGAWRSFVQKVFIYDYQRSTGVANDVEGNWGLLYPDGAPKPAWNDLARLLRTQEKAVVAARTAGSVTSSHLSHVFP